MLKKAAKRGCFLTRLHNNKWPRNSQDKAASESSRQPRIRNKILFFFLEAVSDSVFLFPPLKM